MPNTLVIADDSLSTLMAGDIIDTDKAATSTLSSLDGRLTPLESRLIVAQMFCTTISTTLLLSASSLSLQSTSCLSVLHFLDTGSSSLSSTLSLSSKKAIPASLTLLKLLVPCQLVSAIPLLRGVEKSGMGYCIYACIEF